MKFSPAVSACLMAFSAVSATAVPLESQTDATDFYKVSGMSEFKDGMYALEYKDDGSPSIDFTPLDPESLVNATTTNSLAARDAGCDNFKVPQSETDSANAQLQNACGTGRKGTIWYKVGNVVAFYCQYNTNAMCSGTESQNANKWITQKCGQYWAGSYSGDGYAYGYTDSTLHSFCGIWA